MDLDSDYCYFLLSDFDRIDNNCEFYIRHNDKGKLFPILSYFQFKEEYTEKNTTMYKMIRPTYTLKVKKILFWERVLMEVTGYMLIKINQLDE